MEFMKCVAVLGSVRACPFPLVAVVVPLRDIFSRFCWRIRLGRPLVWTLKHMHKHTNTRLHIHSHTHLHTQTLTHTHTPKPPPTQDGSPAPAPKNGSPRAPSPFTEGERLSPRFCCLPIWNVTLIYSWINHPLQAVARATTCASGKQRRSERRTRTRPRTVARLLISFSRLFLTWVYILFVLTVYLVCFSSSFYCLISSSFFCFFPHS